MKIEIPFKTPSVNHLYGHRGFRKFLTKEAKELKKMIKEIVDLQFKDYYFKNKELKLSVTTTIYENWFNRDGSVKKKDISNREKFLIDSVFEALGLDDKYIFENKLIKKQSFTEYAVIEIEPLVEN